MSKNAAVLQVGYSEALGAWLKARREAAGVSKKRMSVALKQSNSTRITAIERGAFLPAPKTLSSLCGEMGAPVAEAYALAGYVGPFVPYLASLARAGRSGKATAAALAVHYFPIDGQRLNPNGSLASALRFKAWESLRPTPRLPRLLELARSVFSDKNLSDEAKRTVACAAIRAWVRETCPKETEREEQDSLAFPAERPFDMPQVWKHHS